MTGRRGSRRRGSATGRGASPRGGRACAERRVLVVGAGLTGAAAAWALRRRQQQQQQTSAGGHTQEPKDGGRLAIYVWDGARGCGGRLGTARIAVPGAGVQQPQEVHANMGAQRLHYGLAEKEAAGLAAALCAAGILEPAAQDSVDSGGGLTLPTLVPTGASNDVCKHLLSRAGASLRFGARVRAITALADGSGWEVSAFGDDREPPAVFDAVVFGGSVAEVRPFVCPCGSVCLIEAPWLVSGGHGASIGAREGGDRCGGLRPTGRPRRARR
jgi:hypothetical protein